MMAEPIQVLGGSFATDAHAWFEWLRLELTSGRWEASLAAVSPAVWRNGAGHSWRVVRTDAGIEVRPQLESPFIHYGESPKVTALAIGSDVAVELTCRTGRWVDHFPLHAFDVAALGQAMLDERPLPHDNLPMLFPPRAVAVAG
jgi:hypothetical protein